MACRLTTSVGFFYSEDFSRDEESVTEHLDNDQARRLLGALAGALVDDAASAEPTNADRFEEAIRLTAEAEGVEAGDLIHPCRGALTGQSVSAGIFVVMELIGAPRIVARLRSAAGG